MGNSTKNRPRPSVGPLPTRDGLSPGLGLALNSAPMGAHLLGHMMLVVLILISMTLFLWTPSLRTVVGSAFLVSVGPLAVLGTCVLLWSICLATLQLGTPLDVAVPKTPDAEAREITVFVKLHSGETMTLNNIKPSDPVHFISSFVEKRGGAPADLQRLQHCGRQLDGDLPLSEYSISDGSTIHQLLRLRGGTLDLGPQGNPAPLTEEQKQLRRQELKRQRAAIDAEERLLGPGPGEDGAMDSGDDRSQGAPGESPRSGGTPPRPAKRGCWPVVPRYLHQLEAEEIERFIDSMLREVLAKHPDLCDTVGRLFTAGSDRDATLRRLCEDIVFSLARNKYGGKKGVELTITYQLMVNGDPQRGKSQVKAFMAICIHAINRNKSVLDTPYTLLGTVMVAWAKNLQHKLAGSTSRITRASQQQQQPDDEEEDGDEITPDDYEEMKEAAAAWDKAGLPIRYAAGGANWQEAIKQTAREGGVVVFHRNQLNKMISLVRAVAGEDSLAGRMPSPHYVLLDESDRFRGRGMEPNDPTALTKRGKKPIEAYLYETLLSELLGYHSRKPEETTLRAAMVADVSATNWLPILNLFRRHRAPNREVIDLLSFVDDKTRYVGFDRCRELLNRATGRKMILDLGMTARSLYVNEDVLEFFEQVISTPWAAALDITAKAVSAALNMENHLDKVLKDLKTRGTDPVFIAVIITGSDRKYRGRTGIRFCGSTGASSLKTLKKLFATLGVAPPEAIAACDPSLTIHAEDLRPLLLDLDTRSRAAVGYNSFFLNGDGERFTANHVPLILTLLRRAFPGAPVVMIGHGVIERSLSLVGVDYLSGPRPKCILAITHMLLYATVTASASNVVQQAGRACCTFVEFFQRHGFEFVRVLGTRMVWINIRAAVDVNRLFLTSAGQDLSVHSSANGVGIGSIAGAAATAAAAANSAAAASSGSGSTLVVPTAARLISRQDAVAFYHNVRARCRRGEKLAKAIAVALKLSEKPDLTTMFMESGNAMGNTGAVFLNDLSREIAMTANPAAHAAASAMAVNGFHFTDGVVQALRELAEWLVQTKNANDQGVTRKDMEIQFSDRQMVVGDNRFFVHAALKPALDKFKALSVNGVVEYPGGVTLRRDERKSPHRFFIVSYVSATPPASGNGGEGSGAKGIRCDGGGGSSVHEQAQSHLADAEFVKRLRSRGLLRIRVPGDGNCMYHAFADQLKRVFGIYTTASEVRRSVVEELLHASASYDGRQHTGTPGVQLTFSEYVEMVSEPGFYGDSVTLLAACNAYIVNVRVISDYEDEAQCETLMVPSDGVVARGVLELAYSNEIHYDSLHPLTAAKHHLQQQQQQQQQNAEAAAPHALGNVLLGDVVQAFLAATGADPAEALAFLAGPVALGVGVLNKEQQETLDYLVTRADGVGLLASPLVASVMDPAALEALVSSFLQLAKTFDGEDE